MDGIARDANPTKGQGFTGWKRAPLPAHSSHTRDISHEPLIFYKIRVLIKIADRSPNALQ